MYYLCIIIVYFLYKFVYKLFNNLIVIENIKIINYICIKKTMQRNYVYYIYIIDILYMCLKYS